MLTAVLSQLRKFKADRSGVSAVEFAMIAPLMITIYLGSVEVTQAVSVSRKTTLVAHTVADLVAQDSTVTDSEIKDILAASATVASPYSSDNLIVTVSSVKIDTDGNATISWSESLHGTPRKNITVPKALAVPNTSLIYGEVSYDYKPQFGWALTGTFTLSDAIYMRPRLANCVIRSPKTSC
jgi:Flp pilus assembly protein TadG